MQGSRQLVGGVKRAFPLTSLTTIGSQKLTLRLENRRPSQSGRDFWAAVGRCTFLGVLPGAGLWETRVLVRLIPAHLKIAQGQSDITLQPEWGDTPLLPHSGKAGTRLASLLQLLLEGMLQGSL